MLITAWVAVHEGQVVAVGEDMAAVMDQAGQQGLGDAYIENVGGEFDIVFMIRRRTETSKQGERITPTTNNDGGESRWLTQRP